MRIRLAMRLVIAKLKRANRLASTLAYASIFERLHTLRENLDYQQLHQSTQSIIDWLLAHPFGESNNELSDDINVDDAHQVLHDESVLPQIINLLMISHYCSKASPSAIRDGFPEKYDKKLAELGSTRRIGSLAELDVWIDEKKKSLKSYRKSISPISRELFNNYVHDFFGTKPLTTSEISVGLALIVAWYGAVSFIYTELLFRNFDLSTELLLPGDYMTIGLMVLRELIVPLALGGCFLIWFLLDGFKDLVHIHATGGDTAREPLHVRFLQYSIIVTNLMGVLRGAMGDFSPLQSLLPLNTVVILTSFCAAFPFPRYFRTPVLCIRFCDGACSHDYNSPASCTEES